MLENGFAVGALVLAGIFLVAAFIGRRAGDAARDVRLLMGTGAGFGGLALVLAAAQS